MNWYWNMLILFAVLFVVIFFEPWKLLMRKGKTLSQDKLFPPQDFNYDFDLEGSGAVHISSSIPIRNYKTFLREKDEEERCNYGKNLKVKTVTFSLNGSGRTIHRPVQYCPHCDIPPALEYATLICTINGQLVFV
ncbi:MAG: hypothetical protein V1770_00350 [bacterium]